MLRKGGKTTAINSGGRKKLHTTYEDGSEMVEEYDLNTNELLVRKRRSKTVVGKQEPWEFLVGEAERESITGMNGPGLRESSQNPIFARKDLPHAFQWRVRNLMYPKDVYSVTIKENENKIVIRTSNKKYYKVITIPEMDVLRIPLTESSLAWTHANNTLILTYNKPRKVLEAESEEAQAASKIRAQEDGDVDCKQQ